MTGSGGTGGRPDVEDAAVRILAMEDSPTQREKIRFVLEEAGFDVVVARRGEEGLTRLATGSFDVVVSNVVMPGIDGFEVCRRIRRDPVHFRLPIILVTALTEPEEVLHALECGADHFITKPYQPEQLVARVKGILRSRRLREGNASTGPIDVHFLGRHVKVDAERERMIDLLVSTFEDAVLKKEELARQQRSLLAAEEHYRLKSIELERATRAKSEFLSHMSHELRTPLNAIIGYSEFLAEEAGDDGNERQVQDLGKILASARHLLSLINDILDLSKIEAGRLAVLPAAFEVAPLVKEAVATVAPLVERNRNSLLVEGLERAGTLVADAMRVKQVLLNLLSNAAKFTSGGEIRLRVSRGDVHLSLSVSDTGIGLTAEQVERLFQDFSQADETTAKRFGGTGLGLSISRRLCRLMGGDLTVSSEAGKGSTFTVTLPIGS